jgi:Sulfotransferase family
MIDKVPREITCPASRSQLPSPQGTSRKTPHTASKRCCGRLVEILYTQLLVAIAASVVFSIYRSTKVLLPDAKEQGRHGVARFSRSMEKQSQREEALESLAMEAAEDEKDDVDGNIKQNHKLDNDLPTHNAIRIRQKGRARHQPNDNGYTPLHETPSQRNQHPDDNANIDYSKYLVQPTDFIYQNRPGEAAPIVLEEYKLIFFAQAKVGCTVWKLLFRRMMGSQDWRMPELAHGRKVNGLKYLDDYNVSYASHIMTSPIWTRAIIVRDPKERFLSAYLDKAVESQLFIDTCCNRKIQIYCSPIPPAIHEFLAAIRSCPDSHWNPQSQRMEAKYWKYINFVGHMDTIQVDAKRLLIKLNAWQRFGLSGWGNDQTSSIFDSGDGMLHANNAKTKLQEYLHPELEQELGSFYEEDYQNPLFKFTKHQNYKDGEMIPAVSHAKLELPFVEPRDWVYRKSKLHGEASPIVVEKYKLVFFAVPNVAEHEFKRLFRRMMGLDDWKTRRYARSEHHALDEGLVFLRDFNLTRASEILTDPDYTKAIFVRDPKERFSLAYTQTAVRNRSLLHQICCTVAPRLFCMQGKGIRALLDPPNATEFLKGIHTCKSTIWDPITERMGALRRLGIHFLQMKSFDDNYFVNHKHWTTINFVGNMDTAYEDSRALLERLGVWREFGESGWAGTPEEEKGGLDAFFNTSSFLQQEFRAKALVPQVIIDPHMEKSLERLYAQDYNSPWFNLTKKVLFK